MTRTKRAIAVFTALGVTNVVHVAAYGTDTYSAIIVATMAIIAVFAKDD